MARIDRGWFISDRPSRAKADGMTWGILNLLNAWANISDSEDLKRGQLMTSREEIAEFYKIDSQRVRTALAKLKKQGLIHMKTSKTGTLITLPDYQEQAKKGQKLTNDQPTTNQPTNQPSGVVTDENESEKEENKKDLTNLLTNDQPTTNHILNKEIRNNSNTEEAPDGALPSANAAMRFFLERYFELKKFRPLEPTPKEYGVMKQIIKIFKHRTFEVLELFLNDPEPDYVKQGWKLGLILTHRERINLQLEKGLIDRRRAKEISMHMKQLPRLTLVQDSKVAEHLAAQEARWKQLMEI